MRIMLMIGIALALSACAYEQQARSRALDQCRTTPGCATSMEGSPYGPSHAQAIEPAAANPPRR